ncbi:MAG: ABC transporter permease [Planctomycetota bacterium]
MNSKALLVAQREYMENLRTKTFWIGIISFPFIIALSIIVPVLLERAKDVRKYAVLDESGWLLKAVEERAQSPDLAKILRAVRDACQKGKGLDHFPEALTKGLKDPAAVKLMADAKDELLDQMADVISMASSPEGSRIPDEYRKPLLENQEAIRQWYAALPPEQAKSYAPGLSKSQYRRVNVSDAEGSQEDLNKRLNKGEIFAYFVIGADPVAGSEGCKYISKNLTDEDLPRWFAGLASAEVRARRLAKENIPESISKKIQEPLRFESKRLTAAGTEEKVEDKDEMRQWAPVGFVYLLWISVFMSASMLLMNTIEEKSNRLIEVLLSSVSPMQLMSGKIAGIAATGLTVVCSWVVCGYLGIKFLPQLIGGGSSKFDLSFIVSDPVYLSSFVAYFFLGYLMFAALLVAIGSICNSLKEAQNLQQPVVILLIIPLLAMVPIGKDPNGTLAKALSYVPVFTPFVMMNRAAGPPSTSEYVITTLLLVVSIVVALMGAAKIFRIGILMTGKPPRLKEIFQWLKAPVGAMPVRKE